MASIRLNKFLAERLGLSRRQADDAIAAGKVTIDGKIATLGARIEISPSAENIEATDISRPSGRERASAADGCPKILYNGKLVPLETNYIYLALNKPVNYVCSRRRQGDSPTIYELLPQKYQSLKTVGRLDRDSSGLILLTNDGDFAFQMTHPKFAKTKLYEVALDHPLAPLHQQMISDFGVNLPDGPSRLGLERLDDSRKLWRVTMSEGRNRQIRRTFSALGYTVVALHRTQFGPYALNSLKSGAYEEVPKI